MKLSGIHKKSCLFVAICLLTVFCSGPLMAAKNKKTSEPEKVATADNPSFIPIRLIGGVPETLPIPGDERPYAESRFAEEIDKALAFMVFKYNESGRWFWLVLLDYLQRQYDLPERYKLEYNESAKVIEGDKEMRDIFLRFSDPTYILPLEQIEEAEKDKYFLLRSIYCNEYAVDDAFLAEMLSFITEESGGLMSPFALSVAVLRQNKCIGNTRNFMKLRGTLGVNYRSLLEERGIIDGLAAEALAMLSLLDYRDMLEEGWLEEAVSYQNEDGGWPARFKKNSSISSAPAPTIYMLWAMLQDTFPDVEEVSLIAAPLDEDGEENSKP